MRLLPVIDESDDRLPGRQLVWPLEPIVRRMECRDRRGCYEVRGDAVGGAAYPEDKDGKNKKVKPTTSSRHNDDR